MDTKNEILKLIEKYWNAETSLDDERRIAEYVRNHAHDNELTEIAPLFQYFQVEKNVRFPHEKPFSVVHNKNQDNGILAFFRKNVMTIAAMITLAIVSVFILNQVIMEDTTQSSYATTIEIEDPEEAYKTVLAALQKVSIKLNHGEEQARRSIESFNQMNLIAPKNNF
jgi:hypothetical protein